MSHKPINHQNFTIDQLPEEVQAFWQELVDQAIKTFRLTPWLLRQIQRLWERFVKLYQSLRKLPRPTRRRLQRKLGSSLAGVALVLAFNQASVIQAAGITVTTTADILDADCSTITVANLDSLGGDDQISLREAICAANNTAGDDEITLPAGTITLALNPNGGSEDTNAEDDLDILNNGKVSITGDDGGSILDGGGIDGVIDVLSDAQLDLSAVTIQNGNDSGFGGGIASTSTSTVAVRNSTITGNTASAGGGIDASGSFTISNTTISSNTATLGGGIVASTVTVTNSTITDNSASEGGGIFTSGGTVTLSNSLIAGNTATASGNEISANSGTFNVNANNLFGHSGQTEVEAFYGFTPGANDIVATSDNTSTASHTPTALTSILTTTLADNGGSTHTHALVAGSPAIDATSTGPATDQRGIARPQGANFDIGAFELISNQAPVAATDTYTTSQGMPLTVAASGVLGNDTDADSSMLTAILVSGPNNGMLTLNSDGSFTYTPSSGFNGTDTFTYKANDGSADSNIVTVTITVNPVLYFPMIFK